MGYKKWAKRLTKYYSLMEFYFDPQLFVVGGGVSRVSEKFLPYIDIKTPDRRSQAAQRGRHHRRRILREHQAEVMC